VVCLPGVSGSCWAAAYPAVFGVVSYLFGEFWVLAGVVGSWWSSVGAGCFVLGLAGGASAGGLCELSAGEAGAGVTGHVCVLVWLFGLLSLFLSSSSWLTQVCQGWSLRVVCAAYVRASSMSSSVWSWVCMCVLCSGWRPGAAVVSGAPCGLVSGFIVACGFCLVNFGGVFSCARYLVDLVCVGLVGVLR
jgi:hypothetical protein